MLALRSWLAELYAVPPALVGGLAAVNLAFGTTSLALYLRSRDEYVPRLAMMATANIVWSIVCVALLLTWRRSASSFGLLHFALEAIFVGGLGLLEWRASRIQRRPPRSGG